MSGQDTNQDKIQGLAEEIVKPWVEQFEALLMKHVHILRDERKDDVIKAAAESVLTSHLGSDVAVYAEIAANAIEHNIEQYLGALPSDKVSIPYSLLSRMVADLKQLNERVAALEGNPQTTTANTSERQEEAQAEGTTDTVDESSPDSDKWWFGVEGIKTLTKGDL